MKIDSYSMQAASNWKFRSEDIEIRTVKQTATLVGAPQPVPAAEGEGLAQPVSLNLSADAKSLLQNIRAAQEKVSSGTPARSRRAAGCADSPTNRAWEIRRNLLEELLRRLTGKKFVFKEISLDPNASKETRPPASGMALDIAAFSAGGRSPRQQIVVTETNFFASHYESESLRYEAKGTVKTADGRTISIDVGLNMSRELFMSVRGSEKTEELRNFVDPLTIDFSGAAASLTQRKFEFDLDADGLLDSISFPGGSGGFLALDKNGDGRIGDGSELFGPQSGSGFDELRAYDLDGNGWIDENDDVFSKLRVFGKDENGGDLLFTLREADVGAIWLGDVSTQYTLGRDGSTDGMMRSTSVFLKESGGVGLISHIDLAV
jgi:hypothetical protein